jgi:predicted HTH transcriptional regulator
MTIEELESKLEGGAETQTFEVKGPYDWDVKSLAKDILAMSNVQEGGDLVIGIEDGSFKRHGVTAAQKATYNEDIMKDQMAAYADPHVDFHVSLVIDDAKKEYIVITVLPFEEIPVICRKDGSDTKRGCVYYRNKSGRVQSAPVSSSYDMREIITSATAKMMKRLTRMGLNTGENISMEMRVREKLDKEIKDL